MLKNDVLFILDDLSNQGKDYLFIIDTKNYEKEIRDLRNCPMTVSFNLLVVAFLTLNGPQFPG